MSRVLGLDIGATGSRAQLCVDGEVVAESKAASASVVAVGEASAKAALTDVLSQLPLDPQDPLDAVCAGSAGVSGSREGGLTSSSRREVTSRWPPRVASAARTCCSSVTSRATTTSR